tara:strand:- start:2386 stop:3315 length:930 start_codon:yes stop_codon:yes gene_type:complete
MKKIINRIYERIKVENRDVRLILPENDLRIIEAKDKLKELGFQIVELEDYSNYEQMFFDSSKKLKFAKNWPKDKLMEYIKNPLNFGLNIVKAGFADSLIAGAINPTSEVARSSLRFIGLNDKSHCLSSSFLMVSSDEKKVFSYADCAIIPEPSESQLADLAYDTAINHEMLTSEKPKVAFLSFSTNSSADHYRISKVKKAIEIFSRKYSEILHEDCEVQFDTAVDSNIAKKKYSKSILRGDANVLIYPNLDAGNIAYKITQRLGLYDAIGPLLQGLKVPIHDLSRGCEIDDIVDISIIAAYQGIFNANV